MNVQFDSFLDYLRYERNYSEYTIGAYLKDLQQFEDFVKDRKEGIFLSEEIDTDIVRNWIVYLLDNGISPVSVNRKLSSLKSFFKFLTKQGIIMTNPLRFVVGPKTRKSLPAFIKEVDMDLLLDGADFGDDYEGVRDRLILEMLYDTGVRRSELIYLKDVDVDFDAMRIKVTGKRNKQRLIPFAERLKDLMLAYNTID
ncbi:MAG: site-specific integrase, partial [Parabacteroides sp.]|nr:site-specific integrase [Parabacteroides sp.]